MKTIKVINSSRDLYWYHKRIGQYFNVIDVCTNNNYTYDNTTGTYTQQKCYKYTVLDDNGNKTPKTIDCCDCREITISDKINKIKENLK